MATLVENGNKWALRSVFQGEECLPEGAEARPNWKAKPSRSVGTVLTCRLSGPKVL